LQASGRIPQKMSQEVFLDSTKLVDGMEMDTTKNKDIPSPLRYLFLMTT
jgi:hypothetical protein